MQSHVSEFERHQLDVIARVTPHAMAGHILNTSVLAIAVVGSIPAAHLVIWCAYSYAIALVLLYRHIRSRGRVPRSFRRAAVRATVYGVLLALPWGSMAALYLGALGQDQELILVALGVGMAASGSILLSAVPWAALSYMSGILIPSAVKCLVFLNEKGYVLLGVLAASYWWFLAALIAKIAREINERKQADIALRRARSGCSRRSRPVKWSPLRGIRARAYRNAAQMLPTSSASHRMQVTISGLASSSDECIRTIARVSLPKSKG
jgi:hypothetical protein